MGAKMFRKGLVVAVILLFIGMSVVPSTAVQELKEKPFPINFDGNTLYVGGSGPSNYTRIQDAIDNASDGDTVFVYSGIYYENVTVNKKIDLIGEDKDLTILVGGNLITIGVDYVNLSGFYLNSSVKGVHVDSVNHINILDCIFNTEGFGILIQDASDVKIIRNIFLRHVFCAILINFSNNCNISENVFNNSSPIHEDYFANVYIEETDNCIVYKNRFNGITYNPYSGVYMYGCKHNNIESNLFNSYRDTGIRPRHSLSNTVINNLIVDCSWGLRIFSDSCSNDTYNSISNCLVGLIFALSSVENSVINNNFEGNRKSATFVIRSLNNEWDGNYWDRPRIFPYPIVGQILVFIPFWINVDWHPALEPYDIGV